MNKVYGVAAEKDVLFCEVINKYTFRKSNKKCTWNSNQCLKIYTYYGPHYSDAH